MQTPYHYTISGLDNIYLLGGVFEHDTDYGKGISIADIDGLHRLISSNIINAPRRLLPKEFKFLRKEMRCSQTALGNLMGVSDQTIARIEKDETIASVAFEAAFRVLAHETIFGKHAAIKNFLDEINKIEDHMHEQFKLIFKKEHTEWKMAA